MPDEQPTPENPAAGMPGFVPPDGWRGCLCRICLPYDYETNPEKYAGISTYGGDQ